MLSHVGVIDLHTERAQSVGSACAIGALTETRQTLMEKTENLVYP
jgi:hypothetical protein